MQNPETTPSTYFYFSLPRLVAKIRGNNSARSENNWLEANVVGATVHLISYLFLAQLVTPAMNLRMKIVVLVLLVPALLFFWMVILYVNSLIIKSLRFFGLFAGVSNSRAQTVLISIMTTGFAVQLVANGGWTGLLGIAWLAGLIANLASAVVFSFYDAPHAERK